MTKGLSQTRSSSSPTRHLCPTLLNPFFFQHLIYLDGFSGLHPMPSSPSSSQGHPLGTCPVLHCLHAQGLTALDAHHGPTGQHGFMDE